MGEVQNVMDKKAGLLPGLEYNPKTDVLAYPETRPSYGTGLYNLGAATRRGLSPIIDRNDRKIYTRPKGFFRDILPTTAVAGGSAALLASLLRLRTPHRFIAGGLGAAFGADHANRKWDPVMKKKSAWKLEHGNATEEEQLKREVIAKLQSAPGVSFQDANQMATGVSRLNTSQLQQLTRVLSTVSGAAIGSVIMRFLAKTGVIGTMAGGLLGGLLGNVLTRPRPQVDFFGRPVRQTDLFGRSIF